MGSTARKLLPLVACVALGAAAGWFAKPASGTKAVQSEGESEVARERRLPKDAGLAASNNALRRRVRDLESKLAALARDTAEKAVPTNAAERVEPERPRMGPPSMASFREEMERLKKENPAEYAARTNRMAQWRQGRLTRTASQLDWLASIDTSGMTAKQREAHEKYQELIFRREDLMGRLSPDSGATDDEREQARQELHDVGRQLWSLANAERDTLLMETVKAVGISGADAKEVVETVKSIYQNTGMFGFGGGRPPRPPR